MKGGAIRVDFPEGIGMGRNVESKIAGSDRVNRTGANLLSPRKGGWQAYSTEYTKVVNSAF